MAPKKQKAAVARAPASKEPELKQNGTPTRKAKREINKTKFYAEKKEARKVIDGTKEKAAKFVKERVALNPPVKLVQKSIAEGGGRPWRVPFVEWSDELGQDLFVLISTGHSMEAIGRIEGMPGLFQQATWLADKSHPYTDLRARAIANLVPLYEEKVKDIGLSTNPAVFKTRKQVVTKDGDVIWVTEKRETDNVERSKLAVSVLQWTLGHLMPKKHGRNPDNLGDKPNAQLEGLFAALKAGPKE